MTTIHTLSGLPPRIMEQQPTSGRSAPRRSNIHTLSDLPQATILTGSETTGINSELVTQLNRLGEELTAAKEESQQCHSKMLALMQVLGRLEGALDKQDESVAQLRAQSEKLGTLNRIIPQNLDKGVAKQRSAILRLFLAIFGVFSAIFTKVFPCSQGSGSSPAQTTTRPPMDITST